MAATTLTRNTLCNRCETPVRPNKIRCDKCQPIRVDELLDIRNRIATHVDPAHVAKWLPLTDKMLAHVSSNTRKV